MMIPSALTRGVLDDIARERARQDAKWGADRDMPLTRPGSGSRELRRWVEQTAKRTCEAAKACGALAWEHVIAEEVAEAFAAETEEHREKELIQVAASATAAIENIRRRRAAAAERAS